MVSERMLVLMPGGPAGAERQLRLLRILQSLRSKVFAAKKHQTGQEQCCNVMYVYGATPVCCGQLEMLQSRHSMNIHASCSSCRLCINKPLGGSVGDLTAKIRELRQGGGTGGGDSSPAMQLVASLAGLVLRAPMQVGGIGSGVGTRGDVGYVEGVRRARVTAWDGLEL